MSKVSMILLSVAVLLIAGFTYVWRTAGPGTLDLLDRVVNHASYRHDTDLAFGTHGQKLDVWRTQETADTARRPVLIFINGGGWVKGTRGEYGWAARGYADNGFVVVLPDYRKVPDVRFPAFLEDGAEAVRWTRDNIARFGGDPNRVAIAGHSAGGHTVAMLALDPQWLAQAGAEGAVKAVVGLSGPYDFYPFTGRAVAAMGKWPHPQETQPLAYARKDVPPMMLVTGTDDTTVRPKNARNLAARLRAVGAVVEEKEYAGQGHEDIAMALSQPFRGKNNVLADSVAFLNVHLAKPAAPAQ